MTPGFSLRRIFNRRRYFYARVALNPQQALDLCISYWVSTGAWGETPGMREQLAQQGWVGTEITTGSNARHIAVSSVFDEIPLLGLFPPPPQCLATSNELARKTRLSSSPHAPARSQAAPRAKCGASTPNWDTWTPRSRRPSWTSPCASSPTPCRCAGCWWRSPGSSLAATCPRIISSPWTAPYRCAGPPKSSLAAGAHAHPRRDNTTSERLSPASAGRPPHTGRCQWRLPH